MIYKLDFSGGEGGLVIQGFGARQGKEGGCWILGAAGREASKNHELYLFLIPFDVKSCKYEELNSISSRIG